MSLKSKIQALITAANAKTGETDATLTDAVQTLVDGYGQGGTPVINPLSVTANGTYTAPAGVDGYSPVTVNVSGGGDIPLPPGISKQDSGSFTVAAKTTTDSYAIAHNLGEVPKGFYVWTDDETSASATDMYALINSTFLRLTHDSQSGTSVAGNEMFYYRVTTGKASSTSKTMTSAQLSGYVTASQFKVNNSTINFRAGNTYKWIAWA